MRRTLALAALLAAIGGPALAQVETVSAGPERTAVVIYRDQPVDTAELMEQSRQPWARLDQQGLALIVETRTIDLPAGEAVIRLRGVATGIVPQTATLDGLPATVVERNTDFDLLSPGSLLKRSVGEVVHIVRTNPVTGEQTEKAAIVRSGPQGTVLEIDGRLEALGCSGLTERIVFDGVPDGLSDQPVLSVRTRAPAAGRYRVTLAYLATGLQWSSDYVARLSPDGRTLDLTGWITLANFGGTGFPDAPVQVVAGTLHRDDDTVPVDPVEEPRQPNCWPQDTTTFGSGPPPPPRGIAYAYAPVASEATNLGDVVVTGSRIRREDLLATQGELGDYKIYTLPGPTTVAARQTKQVRFLEQEAVRYTRFYRATFWAGDEVQTIAPTLTLRLRNDRRTGLGVPLPGGGVSLVETRDGRAVFAGQATFVDKGVGLPVELAFGQAMDLTVEVQLESEQSVGGTRVRRTVVLSAANDKPEAVELEIPPTEAGYRGFRIVEASTPSQIADSGLPVWRLAVPAGGTRRLRYTIEYEN